MIHTCPYCDDQIPVSSKYEGIIKCDGCGHVFDRKKFLDEQRVYILKKLADLTRENQAYCTDFKYVKWWTSNDQHVCLYCRERANKIFTFDEMRKLIEDNFCQPTDLEQGCRCVILPVINIPDKILEKSKHNAIVKVVSRVKTGTENGEIIKKIVFDLKIDKHKLAKLKKENCTMKIQCPNCGKKFGVPPEYEGRKTKCTCRFVFIAKDIEKSQTPISSPINNAPIEPVVSQSPPPVKCSKCGSTQIMPDKKGFGGGKAFIGGLVLGPLGILAGMHGSKRVVITCLNCGHKWQLEDN